MAKLNPGTTGSGGTEQLDEESGGSSSNDTDGGSSSTGTTTDAFSSGTPEVETSGGQTADLDESGGSRSSTSSTDTSGTSSSGSGSTSGSTTSGATSSGSDGQTSDSTNSLNNGSSGPQVEQAGRQDAFTDSDASASAGAGTTDTDVSPGGMNDRNTRATAGAGAGATNRQTGGASGGAGVGDIDGVPTADSGGADPKASGPDGQKTEVPGADTSGGPSAGGNNELSERQRSVIKGRIMLQNPEMFDTGPGDDDGGTLDSEDIVVERTADGDIDARIKESVRKQRVREQAMAELTSQQDADRLDSAGAEVERTEAARQRENTREDIREIFERGDASKEDIVVEETENGMQARLSEDVQEELVRQRVAERTAAVGPSGPFNKEDVVVEQTGDGSFEARISEQAVDAREEVSERVAGARDETFNVETESKFVSPEGGFDQSDNAGRKAVPQEQELERVTDALQAVESATGVDVADDKPVTVEKRNGEQFGDFDYSAGLGDPEKDEVENQLDQSSRFLQRKSKTFGTDLFQAANESAGSAILKSVGRPDLAARYDREVRKFGTGIITGTAALGSQGLQLVTEVPETAFYATTNPVKTARKTPRAVTNMAALGAESALRNPSQTAGSLVGSAALAGGVFKATQGTRVGLATRASLQPGEELVKAGVRKGVVGRRAARATPGVDSDQVSVDSDSVSVGDSGKTDVFTGGSEPLGSGGTGSVLDPDVVDEAKGVTGPSRTQRLRGEVERVAGRKPGRSPPEFVNTKESAQLGVARPESETGAEIEEDRVTDNLYQQVVDDQLRRSRKATETGDYEGERNPFKEETEQDRRQRDFERRKRRAERQQVTFDQEIETETGSELGMRLSAGGAAVTSFTAAQLRGSQRPELEVLGLAKPGQAADPLSELGIEQSPGTDVETSAETGLEVAAETETEQFTESELGLETESESEQFGEFESESELESEFEFEAALESESETETEPFAMEEEDENDTGFGGFKLSDEVFDTGVVQDISEAFDSS